MKNVFFALVFLLIGTIAFANTNEIAVINDTDMTTSNVFEDNLASHNFSFSYNDNQLLQEEFITLADCTLRGRFKITFSDGSSYSWEGTLTIVGQSCAQFLKELMSDA